MNLSLFLINGVTTKARNKVKHFHIEESIMGRTKVFVFFLSHFHCYMFVVNIYLNNFQ